LNGGSCVFVNVFFSHFCFVNCVGIGVFLGCVFGPSCERNGVISLGDFFGRRSESFSVRWSEGFWEGGLSLSFWGCLPREDGVES